MSLVASEVPWYAELREANRPARVRLLLVGESAPDSGAAMEARRFFYAPVLTRYDGLFRAVVEALYGAAELRAGEAKRPWLERMRKDGVFLIDLVPFPVNKLAARERVQARRQHVAACVAWARRLEPEGVVVCHGESFDLLATPMRQAGLRLMHERRIRFPLYGGRPSFVADVRAAAVALGIV